MKNPIDLPKSLSVPVLTINPKLLGDILFRKDRRLELFLQLPTDKRLELLRNVTKSVRRDILLRLGSEELAAVLQASSPDEATDMLQLLTRKKRESALQLVSQELKDSLSTLLEFDAETAAGLMTLDYVHADIGDTVADVAHKFRQHEKATGRPPVILVMKEGRLAGYMPGHELGFAARSERIDKYVRRAKSISYAAKHDEVFRMFRANPHDKVVVLNDAGSVLGIIYSDDVLKVIQESKASTLYDFAGISPEESVSDSTAKKVEHRYRWLIINLATAFFAAFTVGLFEETIAKYVLLAIYMPIVAGMGGNAATQTLAVLVRGIALKQIELRTAIRTLKNEVGAGFINGMINGVIVAGVVVVFNNDVRLAIVLAMAMVINLVVAGFFGTLVPLVMSRLGKDPAASATIFITTATDVLGFMVFLGLASVILR